MVIVRNVQILPSESVLEQTTYRSLIPSDVATLKKLCKVWFPVDYPNSWYEDVTNPSKGFFTLAAIYEDAIIGAIVAEIKPTQEFNKEDFDILPRSSSSHARAAYVMTLGVVKEHQSLGLGSILMTALVNFVSQPSNSDIKIVYLHVLTTNFSAIRFYERRQFRLHALLPAYYRIKGREFDGYTYVLYVNGGKAPWCLSIKLSRLLCPIVESSQIEDVTMLDHSSRQHTRAILYNYRAYSRNLSTSFCHASSNLIKWVFG